MGAAVREYCFLCRCQDDERIVVVVTPETENLIRKVSAETAEAVAERMEHQMNVHFERMSELVKCALEGYGATLESIDLRLERLEQKVDSKFADPSKMLRGHTAQISALMRQQERPRSSRR